MKAEPLSTVTLLNIRHIRQLMMTEMENYEPLKVLIPMQVEPNATSYWKLDEKTNKLSGFFIELIHLLFDSLNFTYTIDHKTGDFKSYNDLGKIFCSM